MNRRHRSREGSDTFRYEAVSADGSVIRGSVPATDRRSAARGLRERGLVPTYVGASAPPRLGRLLKDAIRPKRSVTRFTEDLATLLDAGVVLERALVIAAETGERQDDSRMARQVLAALRGGESFADALARRSDRFSRLYINTVRTGEAAGALPLVMQQLASFERRRERLRSEVASALAYPAVLLSVGSASILVLLFYVVPRFADSFLMSGIEAPPAMQLLSNARSLARDAWPLLILLPVVALLALGTWIRGDSGRLRLDELLLRLPLLGASLRKAETARFARAMSTMIAASVPLVDALRVARSVVTNRFVANSLESVVRGVRRGEGISQPLEQSEAFPKLAVRLLAVGEEIGEVDAMFNRLAEIYERQTRESLKRFAALFEPLVILGLGIVVGIVILSILTALTSIQTMGI